MFEENVVKAAGVTFRMNEEELKHQIRAVGCVALLLAARAFPFPEMAPFSWMPALTVPIQPGLPAG